MVFSYFPEYKFRHNFHDTLHPLCFRNLEPETTLHYLLSCYISSFTCSVLLNDLNIIKPRIFQFNETVLADIFLYGDSKNGAWQNRKKLMNHPAKDYTNMHHLYYIFFTIFLSWRYVIWGVKMTFTSPSLNFWTFKCLNIQWLNAGDVISILIFPCYIVFVLLSVFITTVCIFPNIE